jgi:hypothetical protein
MPCFTKLVARQRSVNGEGVGRVMSAGVYFMLQAYIDNEDGGDVGIAGEKERTPQPFVGVVCVRMERCGLPLEILR